MVEGGFKVVRVLGGRALDFYCWRALLFNYSSVLFPYDQLSNVMT